MTFQIQINREFHYGSLNSHGSVVLSCFRFCLVSDKSCTARTLCILTSTGNNVSLSFNSTSFYLPVSFTKSQSVLCSLGINRNEIRG